MTKVPLKLEELIDSTLLREELTSLTRPNSGDGSTAAVRSLVLAALKDRLAAGKRLAERLLIEDGSGTACAQRISHIMDEIIRVLYDFAATHVYGTKNASATERMAIVAVGGYGRGTLAPGSDIDLLFLLPYKQTPCGEQIVEYMLYILWDMGLKVGHATRNVDECVRLSRSDTTIRTGILEARCIWGERPLFENLLERFDREVVKGTGPEYVQAKLGERDDRHAKAGESRYLVEPNVKDGKGGLRDLQTLFWIAKYFYRVRSAEELIKEGVFTRAEYNQFLKAEDFLWAVRCHMHFLTGKAEERLHFDIQPEIAKRLGYTTHPGMSGVERFMKHYFLIAKDVGDLTRIFCAALEEEQAKHVPGFNRIFLTFSRRRRKLAGTSDFIVDNHRISVVDDQVFARDPVNLVRLFWFADRHGLEFHPDALKLLRRSLGLVDKNLRRNAEANRLFLDVLTSDRNPELNLRRMNEAGLLGKLIPDFGKIVAMMQFSMYHHYTVDEHLLRCIGVLSEIEHGDGETLHPLSHKLMPGLASQRTVLYVAVLLHDIAKGRPEDHSDVGSKIARRICPHMGLVAGGYRNRRLAGGEPSADVDDGADARPQRSQDDYRLCRRGADGRAAETAAGVDGLRHSRRRTRRVEWLEGPTAAHALLRNRAAADRRVLGSVPLAAGAGGARAAGRSAVRLAGESARSHSSSSTTKTICLRSRSTTRYGMPNSFARLTRPARSWRR